MNNKNGFTLIELLAVIAIIAIISLVAIPNIVGLSDGIRKDNMLEDAKKLISLAKYEVNKNYTIRNSTEHRFNITDLNTADFERDETTGEIKDPDNGAYVLDKSFVIYKKSSSGTTYCISLVGSRRHIGDGTESGCILENELHSRSRVEDGTLGG